MKRVVVSTESVESCLDGQGLVAERGIWWPGWSWDCRLTHVMKKTVFVNSETECTQHATVCTYTAEKKAVFVYINFT